MNFDEIETVTVDSYSTLVDVDSQADALEKFVDGLEDPAGVSRLWRNQYILYSVVANDIDAYRPFDELIDLGLRYALEAHGHDVGSEVRKRIRRTVYEERLAVFEDVPPGIGRIVEAGYDVYVVSNGSPAMLEHLVEAAELEGVISGVVSADEVRTYKPDREIYRHAAARAGTPIDRILQSQAGRCATSGARNTRACAAAGSRAPRSPRPASTSALTPTWRSGASSIWPIESTDRLSQPSDQAAIEGSVAGRL